MTIDTKRLRELAEAARPGPWTRTRDNGVHAGKPKRCIGSMYDSEYVAAANPQAVIALPDRLAELTRNAGRAHERAASAEDALAAMTAERNGLHDALTATQKTCVLREELAAMTTLATEFANRLAGYAHPAVHAADMERIRKVGATKEGV
jgi:hypothetical protein